MAYPNRQLVWGTSNSDHYFVYSEHMITMYFAASRFLGGRVVLGTEERDRTFDDLVYL